MTYLYTCATKPWRLVMRADVARWSVPVRPRLYNAGRRVDVQHWRCGEHNQAGREEFPTGTDSFPCSHSSLKRHTTNIDRILKPIDVSLCPHHRKKVINYIIQFSVNINSQLNRRKSNNKKINDGWSYHVPVLEIWHLADITSPTLRNGGHYLV